MKIKILQADNGDSILLSFKDLDNRNRNILIDGGIERTYSYNDRRHKRPVAGELKTAIDGLEALGEKIDLLVITHIDSDHIGGIVKWLKQDKKNFDLIGKIWFNSGRLLAKHFGKNETEDHLIPLIITEGTDTSYKQGAFLENYFEERKIWAQKIISDKTELTAFGIEFKILSPSIDKLSTLIADWQKEEPDTLTSSLKGDDYQVSLKDLIDKDVFREDASPPNGSSIAFILTYNSKNILFLGDAHPSTVISGLRYFGFSRENPLKAELVKISHHGSQGNTNYELLSLIDCKNFIISTNGKRHNLPNKQCLARIIKDKPGANLYFNYPELIDNIFSPEDRDEYVFFPLSCTEFVI
jgi:beta-lactamase superfamily II metal-dependent hydrolase